MEFTCTAILFDLDGVLVNSSGVVKRHWKQWADRHDIPFERVMAVAHGRMSAETIHLVAPHLDAVEEAHLLDAEEGIDTDGLQVFNTAPLLLRSLPPGSWGVVTSGNLQTASTRLRYGDFPIPSVLVTAEDVQRGKPEPEAYLLGAQRLGVPPAQCVVIEDAPAGIEAAHAAGMHAIAVATTFSRQSLSRADMIVRELASVVVIVEGDRLRVTAEPLWAA